MNKPLCKNKYITIPAVILLVALLVSGCSFQVVNGSGNVISETRAVSGFTSVTLAGIGDVYLTQGDIESVRIEAEDNLIPYFETAVQGDTLMIGIKDQYASISLLPTQPVKFYVTLPKVTAITLAGSGNIFAGTLQTSDFDIALLGSGNIAAGSLAAANLDIHLNGSGNITLGTVSADVVTENVAGSGDIQVDTLAARTVTTKTTGSGNISIGGKVTDQSAVILGSGDYRAGGLKSDTASLRVAGSGNSQVAVASMLNVTILGSGDVIYSGSPKVVASIVGSGKVNPASQ
ncbi:MAG: head GIN domain-containing protein [Anaerolineales bacterium]